MERAVNRGHRRLSPAELKATNDGARTILLGLVLVTALLSWLWYVTPRVDSYGAVRVTLGAVDAHGVLHGTVTNLTAYTMWDLQVHRASVPVANKTRAFTFLPDTADKVVYAALPTSPVDLPSGASVAFALPLETRAVDVGTLWVTHFVLQGREAYLGDVPTRWRAAAAVTFAGGS